jgi:hypothetical protein
MRRMQFSLASLLEFTTICSVLLALSPLLGLAATLWLIFMSLSVSVRIGPLAIVAFGGALLADTPGGGPLVSDASLPRTAAIVGSSLAISFWYRWRRSSEAAPAPPPTMFNPLR